MAHQTDHEVVLRGILSGAWLANSATYRVLYGRATLVVAISMKPYSNALQEKHVETAKLLLGEGRELNSFVSRLLDDMANLKAMLHAISIGELNAVLLCIAVVNKWALQACAELL